jgi:hypothetical protein
VLLSGTPMQNHLDEFFAMVDFCNPVCYYQRYVRVTVLLWLVHVMCT